MSGIGDNVCDGALLHVKAGAHFAWVTPRRDALLRLLAWDGFPNDPAQRVEYCALGARAAGASDDEPEERKALATVCRLLRADLHRSHKILASAYRVGAAETAAIYADALREPDYRCVGHVYLAMAAEYPGLVKIGFSRQPENRAKGLARHYGTPIEIIGCWASTLLVEQAIHLWPMRRVASEWYRDSQIPDVIWRRAGCSRETTA